ncbi:MAG: Fe-S cluster assembly protein SufD [Saprospiraceae bacterium]|nr:Fe-S cluster assembly protein SufD [Saprospiraceae bacterium]
MTTETKDKNISRFLTLFGELERGLNGQKENPAHHIRQSAIKELASLAFPTRRDEAYKYTSVTRIISEDYDLNPDSELEASTINSFRIPDLDAVTLVFVNGVFRQDLSDQILFDKGVSLKALDKAIQNGQEQTWNQEWLTLEGNEEKDPFHVMNKAFARTGYLLHVPKQVQITKPLHFLYVNTQTDKPFLYSPQRVVVLEQGSSCTLIESFHSTASGHARYFSNIFNRIIVRENAEMHHYKIQQESLEAFQMNNTEVVQYNDSRYSNYTVDLGGRIIRNNLTAIHKGQNVTSNFYGSFYGRKEQHIDNHTYIDHAIPHCQSNELYKGILTDKARGVFNGKVLVRKDAQKTNAFQQNASLVLSNSAVMDSKPQLEIFADDVKCSHGATIGQLDERSVFYMRSRGMKDTQARALLQYAFLLDVLEFMPHEALQAYAKNLIFEKFSETL